jgi:hypothetical protein
MFPANCVSDSPNASRIMHEQAKANAMIAEAEDILFTAEREPSRVAILYPRSSEMWDEWHTELASGMCMCCCVSSMVARYIEYTVEAYLLRAMQLHVMQLHVIRFAPGFGSVGDFLLLLSEQIRSLPGARNGLQYPS